MQTELNKSVTESLLLHPDKQGKTDISFTLHRSDLTKAEETLNPLVEELGNSVFIETTKGIGKLCVVGIGMRSHSGIAAQMFSALADNGINIQMISTSEIKTAVTIDESQLDKAANVVHTAFNLSSES